MKLDLNQDSEDWAIWRGTGVTGTEIAVIMGVSPWTTPLQLFNRKTGREPYPDISDQYQVQRGIRLEPEILKAYCDETEQTLEAACFVHDDEYRFKGSLDGINAGGTHFIEIKTGGKKLMDDARNGEIPDYYKWQMDWYYYLTGANTCDFVVGDESTIVICPYYRDEDRIAQARVAASDWLKRLDDDKPPPITTKDVVLDESDERKRLADLLRDLTEQEQSIKNDLKPVQDQIATVKKSLIDLTGENTTEGFGVKVTRYWVKSKPDYDKFLTDKHLELPKEYAEGGRWQYRITLSEDK